jgi:hypothetical protein
MALNPYGPIQLTQIFIQNQTSTVAYATHEIHGEIIVKLYKLESFGECWRVFRELFLQAKFTHLHVCKILDVYMATSTRGKPELVLCLEKLEKDLAMAIEERSKSHQSYSEEELWDFLQITTEVLCAAQNAVVTT